MHAFSVLFGKYFTSCTAVVSLLIQKSRQFSEKNIYKIFVLLFSSYKQIKLDCNLIENSNNYLIDDDNLHLEN